MVEPVVARPAGELQSESDARPKRVNPIRLRQMEERREAIEEEVARLEAAISDIEREMALFRSAEETKRLADKLNQSRSELEAILAEWEEVTRCIEQAGA